MKRWNGKEFAEDSKIDLFLEDVKEVCKKHGLSISHEDWHGCFEIEEYSDKNIKWLFNASNRT